MGTSLIDQITKAVREELRSKIGPRGTVEVQIPDENFHIQKRSWVDKNASLPLVLIVPVTPREVPSTNLSSDIGFGAQVTIVEKSNREFKQSIEPMSSWREQAEIPFRDRYLPLDPTDGYCTIEHKAPFDPAAFANQYDASAFVVRCTIRVMRPSC